MANRRNTNTLMPIVLVVLGAALIIGAVIFFILNQPSINGVSAEQPTAPAAARIPFPGVARISVADAKAAYDAKLAVFVDVRDAGSFAQGHIPGAVNIPLDTIENQPVQASLDKNQWIITYCT